MVDLEQLANHPDRDKLLRDVAVQLEKDLNRSGIKTNWRDDELNDNNAIIANLRDILHNLYNTDRAKLSAIMYAVDLSEQQVNKQLNRPNAKDMPDELAILILKRVLQKVVLRSYYGKLK